VPSMVRAWRHSGCMAGLAWERHLRCFSSTGAPCILWNEGFSVQTWCWNAFEASSSAHVQDRKLLIGPYPCAGEASSPDDCQWLMAQARYQCPILEYCGGARGHS
jgi:hypothetical protein